MQTMRKGSKGEEVRALQGNLKKLGFPIQDDGIYGDSTYNSVITVQSIFGYDVDGLVGPATEKLIDKQLARGWKLEAARNAVEKRST